MQGSVELVRAIRGRTTEEIHRGFIVVLKDGDVIFSLGSSSELIPMRSVAKPFQIVPLLESGGMDRFSLGLDDIATMVSSHNGEDIHVQQVRSLLARGGLAANSLRCGVQTPYFPWIADQIYRKDVLGPSPIHNNCSGKHAGMLLLCTLMGLDIDADREVNHPAQQLTGSAVARFLGMAPDSIHLALDGCGVPTFCVPLENIALAYESLSIEYRATIRSPLNIVAHAMLAYPQYVAGKDRLDTEVMLLHPILAKSGSSGVYAIAVPEHNVSIAIKIESGSEDASECAAVAILHQLGIIGYYDIAKLHGFDKIPTVFNAATMNRFLS